MPNLIRPELLVRPAFYDALSGEFRPPTDTQGRAHTLGRLAIATYNKGEPVAVGNNLTGLEYTPSWAPSVNARIWLGTGNVLAALTVTGPYDRGVIVADLAPQNVVRVVAPADMEDRLSLELGPDLLETRTKITRFAQDFFNQVALIQPPR